MPVQTLTLTLVYSDSDSVCVGPVPESASVSGGGGQSAAESAQLGRRLAALAALQCPLLGPRPTTGHGRVHSVAGGRQCEVQQ